MPRERNLERLLNEEKLPNFYHDVNATNFNIYLCQTNVDDINFNTLHDFFGDGLFSPNIQGEYLTNILARSAFKGTCNLEKTTKLFSFIYDVINPNYPGKTCNLCSLMEFVLLSYKGLVLTTNENFACDYFLWLLNNNLEAGFDINYRDSCYNHFLIYCTLVSFCVGSNYSKSNGLRILMKKITECTDDILLNNEDLNHIERMIRYCCNEKSFFSLLKIQNKLLLENDIISNCNKTIEFPCNKAYEYVEYEDCIDLQEGLNLLTTSHFKDKIYQKYQKYSVKKDKTGEN